jgi:hypothetical protein
VKRPKLLVAAAFGDAIALSPIVNAANVAVELNVGPPPPRATRRCLLRALGLRPRPPGVARGTGKRSVVGAWEQTSAAPEPLLLLCRASGSSGRSTEAVVSAESGASANRLSAHFYNTRKRFCKFACNRTTTIVA